MSLRDRLVDPRSPTHRPRKAAYALPTLFTAGNVFLGYLAILRSFRGAMAAASGMLFGIKPFYITPLFAAAMIALMIWCSIPRHCQNI